MVMSFKTAVLASVLVIAGAGCGDTCDDARDHIDECGSTANPGNDDEDCSGVVECAAECVNDASCEAITGTDADGANTLATCLNKCGPEG
jgi:hypothetical protein